LRNAQRAQPLNHDGGLLVGGDELGGPPPLPKLGLLL
jgi:hypothetical protein